MREYFTIKQAASAIGVSAQVVREWLAEMAISTATGKDKRARYLTRAQVVTLATAHHRVVQDEGDLAGLVAELQALRAKVEHQQEQIGTLESRVAALEARPTIRPSLTIPATPAPAQRVTRASSSEEDTAARKPPRSRQPGRLTRSEAARLLQQRHGANYDTARQWHWPDSALGSEEAAILWALEYVGGDYRRQGKMWIYLCNVPGCPCRRVAYERYAGEEEEDTYGIDDA